VSALSVPSWDLVVVVVLALGRSAEYQIRTPW
jgi:hypothetical protein